MDKRVCYARELNFRRFALHVAEDSTLLTSGTCSICSLGPLTCRSGCCLGPTPLPWLLPFLLVDREQCIQETSQCGNAALTARDTN